MEATKSITMIPISILVLSVPVLYASLSPPHTLFHDTTFWFLISNTIILIVAADSGLFSPSPSKDTLPPLPPPTPPQLKETRNYPIRQPPISPEPPPEVEEKVIYPLPALVEKKEIIEIENSKEMVAIDKVVEKEEELKKRWERSRSDVAVGRSEAKGRRKLRRSSTEKKKKKKAKDEEEESGDVYSKLSDEELNRRVEEFIRRFREVRLQEVVSCE